jgi:hypothetical protein
VKGVGRPSGSGLLRILELASVTSNYARIHGPAYLGSIIAIEGEVDHLRMGETFEEGETLVIGEVGRAARREKPAHRRGPAGTDPSTPARPPLTD